MANNTCEGSKEPDVQALPLDAQIPSKSNDKRIDSPSINSKLILEFPGNLLSPLGPFNLAYGILSRIPSINLSLNTVNLALFS